MPVKYYQQFNGALTAATAKTVLELPTPANVAILIEDLVLTFDIEAAGSVRAELGQFTTTGTGTSVAAGTIQKQYGNPNIDSAITALKINDTVEPSGFTRVRDTNANWPGFYVPTPGIFPFQWPLGGEFEITESVNFALRLNSTDAGNYEGWIAWRE